MISNLGFKAIAMLLIHLCISRVMIIFILIRSSIHMATIVIMTVGGTPATLSKRGK